ncbi:hypothetical protein VTJ49DRAFT_7636 [Mycothermus thermophilus]|uniref:Bud22 domain-containing protein n=1 Tax=Humicola insolens TaxID=85995 RepID=A0ABR3VGA1_HUMIN
MPKRKRDSPTLDALFARHRADVFHALKTAKGHERQRQSKRLSDKRTDPAKRARIENEVVVLKSLDLQQTAHAHLCSSLLRLKPVAALPEDRLPEALRAGVPKPELTEEERAALHNVTSSLYNRPEVKKVVEKAVEEMCQALGVEVPKKGGRADGEGKKGSKDGAVEDGKPGKKDKQLKAEDGVNGSTESGKKKERKSKADEREDAVAESAKRDKKSKAEGRIDDAAKSGKEKKPKSDASEDESSDEIDEEEEEKAISELDKFLGLGSDEEEDSDEEVLVKGRIRKPPSKELDPMEITTEEEDSESEDDEDDEDSDEDNSSEGGGQLKEEAESSDDFFDFSAAENETSSSDEDQSSQSSQDDSDSESSSSASRSPPAKKPKRQGKKEDVWALPALMAGYISGSESASDIDEAAVRKNRRGQRARQAIWEKKFGDKAKHLQKQARDAGWDLKRGAVEPGAKPWKHGIRNPLLDKGKEKGGAAEGGNGKGRAKGPAGRGGNLPSKDSKPSHSQGPPKKAPAPRSRDDTGPLHPSWEAKRKAKEKMLTAPFQGKKITFD